MEEEKTLNGIIKITKLIEKIENDEYIDCNKDDLYDGDMYESILTYLKFAKGFFVAQNIDKIYNFIQSEKEKE